jgi:hypothetical protein
VLCHPRLEDGHKYNQVGGNRRFTTESFGASDERYEIEIRGGASQVDIAAR